LRIGDQDRRQLLAQKMGLSENRLYWDLIQEGLLVREQMAYLEKLPAMRVPANDGLTLLDLARDVPPGAEDKVPEARRAWERLRASRGEGVSAIQLTLDSGCFKNRSWKGCFTVSSGFHQTQSIWWERMVRSGSCGLSPPCWTAVGFRPSGGLPILVSKV